MAGQIMDRLFAFKDGGLMGMADSIEIEYQGSPIPINTLAEDFVGVYPTPKMAVVTIDQFVSTDSADLDPTADWLATTKVTIKAQLGGSGKVMEADGFVDAPSIKSSPTDPTKRTFKVMVKAVAFS